MVVIGAMPVNGINIPENLKNKILIGTTTTITQHDKDIYMKALELVEQRMLKERIEINKRSSVNIFFTENGTIHFEQSDDLIEFGTHCHLITYRMDKMREVYNDKFKFFVFVEELAHHFWRIEDEEKVKYKVLDILKPLFNISIDTVKEWGVYGI